MNPARDLSASAQWLVAYLLSMALILTLTAVGFHWVLALDIPDALWRIVLPGHWGLALMAFLLLRSVRDRQALLQGALLLLSLGLLMAFLLGSGGYTNPLVSLLLVPVALSAILLHWPLTVALGAAAVGAYALLMQHFLPLRPRFPDQVPDFAQLHLSGMALTFVISVVLLVGLITPMVSALRRQQGALQAQRERMLRDERLVAMASSAALTAHQLGTPLSTLAVLIDDLQDDARDPCVLGALQTMEQQVQICKQILRKLLRRASDSQAGVRRLQTVAGFVEDIRQQYLLLHPTRTLELVGDDRSLRQLAVDDTLEQALLNLLDNAAEADPEPSILDIQVGQNEVVLGIVDQGPGLDPQVARMLGRAPLPQAGRGHGVGLFLSHATIDRFGGRLQLIPQPRGTRVEVRLPLTRDADERNEGVMHR